VPRDLSDVLHYFLPELDGAGSSPPDAALSFNRRAETPGLAPPRRRTPPPRRETSRAPLSILGVPLGERDVVHAAYTWNLAVETTRLGGSSAIITPDLDRAAPLWPATGSEPRDLAIIHCAARSLPELRQAASELAAERGKLARRGGIVFARIPPDWLAGADLGADPELRTRAATGAAPGRDSAPAEAWIRWLLVFTSTRRRDMEATFERVSRWVQQRPGLEVGVTIHGVRQIAEARAAYDELAQTCTERLGVSLASYGLLVDDLEVYRSIAAARPISVAHPHSPATRALTDVARLLYGDARSRVIG